MSDPSADESLLQQRHKPPRALERPRGLIVACSPMRSNVNLSQIVRAAGCWGVDRIIACGNAKVVGKIARDAETTVGVEVRRTLVPVLRKLQGEGYRIIALEQTETAQCIFDFAFPRRSVLVVGNERLGVAEVVLRMADDTIEIPVYGRPYSHNAASATVMALYEYGRQYPAG